MASSDSLISKGIRLWPMCLALVIVAGCSGGGHKSATGLFDNQNQAAITCMNHQKQQPGALYTAGERADTAHILEMMQYFTSYGDKPYCDGKSPTATDSTWGQLYVSLGGQPAKVITVLRGH